MSKQLYLGGKYGSTIGNYAIVDDDKFEELKQYKWYATKIKRRYKEYIYVKAYINKKEIRLHRYLLNIKDVKIYVDHINGNTLDYQLINLRSCSPKENSWNRTSSKHAKIPFKGVYIRRNRFYSYITVDAKRYLLGIYKSAEDAAEAYDRKSIELQGSFARLNFPDKDYPNIPAPINIPRNKSTGIPNISYNSIYNRYTVTIKIKNKVYRQSFLKLEEAENYLKHIKRNQCD